MSVQIAAYERLAHLQRTFIPIFEAAGLLPNKHAFVAIRPALSFDCVMMALARFQLACERQHCKALCCACKCDCSRKQDLPLRHSCWCAAETPCGSTLMMPGTPVTHCTSTRRTSPKAHGATNVMLHCISHVYGFDHALRITILYCADTVVQSQDMSNISLSAVCMRWP